MNIRIEKSHARGSVTVPPSKSMAHRLLILAGLCEGESTVRGAARCDDVEATLDCLRAMGVQTAWQGEDIRVRGVNPRKRGADGPLLCRESGSTLRFLIPPALLSGRETVLRGAPGLMRRPMDVYGELCAERGYLWQKDGEAVTVRGPLKSGVFRLPGNISSQFISGLLFALPLCEGDSEIHILPPVESRSYIGLTLDALSAFGGRAAWRDERTLYIPGGQTYRPADVRVEGDFSSAAYIGALGALGDEVAVEGLPTAERQGDSVYRKYFALLKQGVPAIHIGDCPDLGPILFAVAAAYHGGVFSGTRRLRIKESDRVAAMAEELQKFGTRVDIYEDTTVVYPADFHPPVEPLFGHGDHRVVMALSVLLTRVGGTICGAEAVRKSYPAFFEHLRALGVRMRETE